VQEAQDFDADTELKVGSVEIFDRGVEISTPHREIAESSESKKLVGLRGCIEFLNKGRTFGTSFANAYQYDSSPYSTKQFSS
jgi:hypothetical protein